MIAAAWRARRRPDAHKRLVVLATISFAAGALAVPFGMTPAWHRFAKFVMRTAVPWV